MNKFLRVTFILLFLAMMGAAMIQIFQPQLLGNESIYGLAPYWQREIGFWNLAILPLVIATNHLLGYLEKANQANFLGWIENYLLVFCWIIGWGLEYRKRQKNDEETV